MKTFATFATRRSGTCCDSGGADRRHHRPSRARTAAGLSGFLVLIQSPEWPDRLGRIEPLRHDALAPTVLRVTLTLPLVRGPQKIC
jgi:hypothetical protein